MDELTEELGYKLEQDYVKSSYDDIANKFSETRYKKWPKVDEFLKSLAESSLLLDVGCGNGKYLSNASTFNIGCDISMNLLQICKQRGFEVVQCDMTRLPFRAESFDNVICVAALHHVVTTQRRQKCLENMIELLSCDCGRLLVQVWSYEQELKKDNPYLKQGKAAAREGSGSGQITIKEGLSLPIHKNRTPFQNQDLLVPFKVPKADKKGSSQTSEEDSGDQVRLRYYHVFKEKELDSMLMQIMNVKIIESYYDCGNWCSVIRKV